MYFCVFVSVAACCIMFQSCAVVITPGLPSDRVWHGVVKCVLQGLCVEKCVVRCGEVCVAGFIC